METSPNGSEQPKVTVAEQRAALAEALRTMADHVEAGGGIDRLARGFEEMSVGLEMLAAAERAAEDDKIRAFLEKTESAPA